MDKLCEYIVQFFENKGWTPKRLVIWLAVGWVFQILAGIGLITYLMTKGYLEYQKGSNGSRDNSNEKCEGSDQRNVEQFGFNSSGDLRERQRESGQAGNREGNQFYILLLQRHLNGSFDGSFGVNLPDSYYAVIEYISFLFRQEAGWYPETQNQSLIARQECQAKLGTLIFFLVVEQGP